VWNVPQISPCRFSAFRSRKIPHFRGSQNYCSLALHNRCATDAYQRQASRGPLKDEKNGLLDIAVKQEQNIQYRITIHLSLTIYSNLADLRLTM